MIATERMTSILSPVQEKGLVSLRDIEEARTAIEGVVKKTPCLVSRTFSAELGFHACFKYETLQLTGSFKVRGAYNKIRSLAPEQSRRGVITASAGNHAQGVAFSAGQLGIAATIVMPLATPLVKIENTERLGGRVVLSGEGFDEAYREAQRLEEEQGLTFVHPFNDPLVIAGQGTMGLEILEQAPEVEVVVVPIGGGGLISGVATAIKETRPSVRVYGVQTEAAPAMSESFHAGRMVASPTQRTVAEGISVKNPGELTFEHIRRYVDDVQTVSEAQIRAAIVKMIETGKVVTEGAAAATVAAMYAHRFPDIEGRHVVVVLSGANIDTHLLSRIIDRSLVDSHRLVRFKTHVTDRPGALADLLGVIAGEGGNVVRIQHDRVFKQAGFWDAEVEITLETRNLEHIERIHDTLRRQGYDAERLD